MKSGNTSQRSDAKAGELSAPPKSEQPRSTESLVVVRRSLAGQRSGKLLVLNEVRRVYGKTQSKIQWLCRCDCGAEKWIHAQNIIRKKTICCGSAKCKVRGGMYEYRSYQVWRFMKFRCLSPACASYPSYGGRGIAVCARWMKFENFLKDMGEAPVGASIHRVNNDLGYEPGNCKWSNPREQARNRRSSRLLTHNGTTLCVAEWADKLSVPVHRLINRLRCGWPTEAVLSTARYVHHSRKGGARAWQ